MLTKGDDFPIHQNAEPIAYSGTDRNFYDRYFFNGYTPEGDLFFACALGVYPHLNIMDGAFCIVADGIQHNIHLSRHLGMERMDTQVGPLSIEVIEPLRRLRVRLGGNEFGISAELDFEALAPAIEEPRFSHRVGPRVFMDYTRMTQNGNYEGWVDVRGKRFQLTRDRVVGTRDRSWGVRPVGLPDAQKPVPDSPMQFYWVWSQLNFDDCFTLYLENADERGIPWNKAAEFGMHGPDEAVRTRDCDCEIVFEPGSRHAKSAIIKMNGPLGETRITLKPLWKFYMSGLGYLNSEWGHGFNKGEFAIGYDAIALDQVNTYLPPHLHIEAFVHAEMTTPDGRVRHGRGVFEQLFLGPHKPSGFKDFLDPAA